MPKRADLQTVLKGVNFGRRSPGLGGQNCTPKHSVWAQSPKCAIDDALDPKPLSERALRDGPAPNSPWRRRRRPRQNRSGQSFPVPSIYSELVTPRPLPAPAAPILRAERSPGAEDGISGRRTGSIGRDGQGRCVASFSHLRRSEKASDWRPPRPMKAPRERTAQGNSAIRSRQRTPH